MDGSGDSLLIDSAAALGGLLDCNSQNIADLTGIEYFVNITRLYCYNNQLTILPDLTNNTALQWLYCQLNQLTALPALTNNTGLQYLGCSNNQLTALPDLTNNTALIGLYCHYNQLTVLPDLTNNIALIQLNCSYNQLTALPDLTNNTALIILSVYYNQLTALPDLTNNTALWQLDCSNNQLTALPALTNNTALSYLWCFNNQLTALPAITNNIALKELACGNNKLTTLPDLSNNTSLQYLYCDSNKLDFSVARELRIADTISTLLAYNYSPQNPFGIPDTFDLNAGDTLILSIANQDSSLSYQWFRGVDTIAGATDTFLIIPNVTFADSEIYTCRSYGTALLYPSPMTNGPGISSFVSEGFLVNISPVGISKLFDTDNWLKLYPNPNTGEFTLEMEISEKQDIQINITNILGQSVYAETLNNINGKYKKQIDLKPNPSGIYNLQILNEKTHSIKLIFQ